MRRFSTIILAGLIAGIFLFQGVVAAQNTIKIGMIDTYTGPPSVYCNDVKDGFKLALDEINAKGGVLGKKLEFVTRDDKFKVDLALSAAKKLVMRENVEHTGRDHKQRSLISRVRSGKKGEDPLRGDVRQERGDNRSQGQPICLFHE